MRTYILFIIIAICSLSLTTSCTSREQKVVKRLEKLSKKLERQGNDYSITQWQRAAKEFKQIDEEIAKNYQDFTPKQLHEIGRLKGICVGAFSRYLEHIAKKSSNEADGFVQGLEEICGKQDVYPSDNTEESPSEDYSKSDSVYIETDSVY